MTYFLVLNLPRLLVVTRVYLANARLTLHRLIEFARKTSAFRPRM
jgi:hypothetical protein